MPLLRDPHRATLDPLKALQRVPDSSWTASSGQRQVGLAASFLLYMWVNRNRLRHRANFKYRCVFLVDP